MSMIENIESQVPDALQKLRDAFTQLGFHVTGLEDVQDLAAGVQGLRVAPRENDWGDGTVAFQIQVTPDGIASLSCMEINVKWTQLRARPKS